jgi:hypothetical protein
MTPTPHNTMAIGLARYGLDQNPFTEGELNPLEEPAHADKVVTFGSFERLVALDSLIRQRAEEGKSCIFLVVGRRGAGRSTVAHHILARYMHHRGVQRDRFIVPVDHAQVGNHDDYSVLRKWVVELSDLVDEAPFNLPETATAALEEAEKADRDVFAATLRKAARRLARALKVEEPSAAFGVRLENVKSAQQVSSVVEAFGNVETAVVLTALDYESVREDVVRPYAERMQAPLDEPVRLDPLRGDEAHRVIDDRWRQHSEHVSPFDPEGVKQAFGRPQRPIGRVLRLAGGLLEGRAAEPGGLWPDAADLALSKDAIPQLVINLLKDYE